MHMRYIIKSSIIHIDTCDEEGRRNYIGCLYRTKETPLSLYSSGRVECESGVFYLEKRDEIVIKCGHNVGPYFPYLMRKAIDEEEQKTKR